MEANLEEPLAPSELANLTGITVRQLERLFKHQLQRTPTRYYQELRLTHARQLVLQGDAPVGDVALACGFGSAAHFSKAYSRLFGVSPSAQRRLAALR